MTRDSVVRRRSGPASRVGLVLAAVVAIGGCGLDGVDVPEIDGPSTFALSLTLRAVPDLLVADGTSTALVTATLRGPDGRPVSDREIFFTIADESGRFADIGSFLTQNGPGTGVTVRTNGQGIAQVVYQTPPRTDATANQSVLIAARPIGDDYNAAIYRTVRIELRSAEPRLFPPNPNNILPTCGIVSEAPNGFRINVAILFQTSSFDPDGVIVRYEWFCGNNNTGPQYSPDIACVYRTAGTYTVTHRVTDDDGGQSTTCTATVTVQ